MMCTANIPLERFFLFPFSVFVSFSFYSFASGSHLPFYYILPWVLGWIIYVMNLLFACGFVMYTYTGNVHER